MNRAGAQGGRLRGGSAVRAVSARVAATPLPRARAPHARGRRRLQPAAAAPDAYSPGGGGGGGAGLPPPSAGLSPLPAASAWAPVAPPGAPAAEPRLAPGAPPAGEPLALPLALPLGHPQPHPLAPPAAPIAALPVASPAPLMPALLEQIAEAKRRAAAESEAEDARIRAELAVKQEAALAERGEARARWTRVVGVCGAAALLMYATRTSISTAILPMAEQYGWGKGFCGTVLSAFFAGYSVTQVLGGQLSDQYGGSLVLAAGLAGWSLCAALTPYAAGHSAGALLAARAGLGAAQGVAFPAIHALLAKGVPPSHRSGAIGTIMALAHTGTALASGLSPALISFGGWPFAFHSFAALAVAWALPWGQMHADLRRVAAASAAAAAPAPATAAAGGDPQQQQQAAATPAAAAAAAARPAKPADPNVGFWPLMRRREVWAIAVAQYASSVGFYGLLAWLPTFLLERCGLELSKLGAYTLAPYLLQAAVGAFAGGMADELIQRRKWRVRDVRVLMQCTAMLGPAVALTLAASPLVAGSAQLAVAFITLGMGLSALSSSGVSASHLDIAPRHAGVVFGVGNTAGTIAGLIAVPAIGYVLAQTGSWALAFGIAAAHNVAGAALWALWVGDSRLREDGGHADADAAAALAAAAAAGGKDKKAA
ncbi:MFS family transporter: phosphate sugar [Raphidocelis subcapitata]|uniref:MFS family transporter: phosphate sugar n=1 Tax=Raphidocelis subcapitata TaxID=307507 RepID=A0A2V0PDD6_9CHLO|nr:MFS family transporter: phosphate sugar [Raphidocelis subcapitata]|eukprot:GBF97856.1 MFS family transporter: phosphate sugar [Raphidocelis subcapitata]